MLYLLLGYITCADIMQLDVIINVSINSRKIFCINSPAPMKISPFIDTKQTVLGDCAYVPEQRPEFP